MSDGVTIRCVLFFLIKITFPLAGLVIAKKSQVGNDPKMAQSEGNYHSKNGGGKTKLTITE